MDFTSPDDSGCRGDIIRITTRVVAFCSLSSKKILGVIELLVKDHVSANLDSPPNRIPEPVSLLGERVSNEKAFKTFGIQFTSLSSRNVYVGDRSKNSKMRHVFFCTIPRHGVAGATLFFTRLNVYTVHAMTSPKNSRGKCLE